MTNQATFQAGSKVRIAGNCSLSSVAAGEGQVGIATLERREGKPPVWMYSVWFDGRRLTIGEHDLVVAK